ncbi:MAG: FHA domain-containing protein [Eubacteriales bacterium]|jgi:hypothetical protein
MKRLIALLLLTLCLLVPLTHAAPADNGVATLRIVYHVTVPALGDASYTISGTAMAVAVAHDELAVYYVTDASIYEFGTAALAAQDAIGKLFEKNALLGLKPEDYAAEFKVTGAIFELMIDGKAYEMSQLYNSDTFAVLMVVDAPAVSIPARTSDVGDAVTYYAAQMPFDITSDAAISPISAMTGTVDSATDGITLTNPYTFQSLGSPLIDASGRMCGLVYYDVTAGEVRAIDVSTIEDRLTRMQLTGTATTAASGTTAANTTAAATTVSGTTASEKTTTAATLSTSGATSLTESENFRTIVIYATCIAGALLILILLTLIIRTHTSRRIEAEQEALTRAAAVAKPAAAVRTVEPRQTRPAVREIPPEAPRMRAGNPAEPVRTTAVHTPKPAPRMSRPIVTPTTPEPTQKPPRAIMLAVLDGNLQGFTLNVSDTVTLGRDPKLCRVVFGASQTEISRCHCSVTYNPQTGDIILEDLNSTNGTYTPDGRRYAAGRKYLLRSGDRFCLGTRENLVEVRA